MPVKFGAKWGGGKFLLVLSEVPPPGAILQTVLALGCVTCWLNTWVAGQLAVEQNWLSGKTCLIGLLFFRSSSVEHSTVYMYTLYTYR